MLLPGGHLHSWREGESVRWTRLRNWTSRFLLGREPHLRPASGWLYRGNTVTVALRCRARLRSSRRGRRMPRHAEAYLGRRLLRLCLCLLLSAPPRRMSLSRLSFAAFVTVKGDPVPIASLATLAVIQFVMTVGMLPFAATLTATDIAAIVLKRAESVKVPAYDTLWIELTTFHPCFLQTSQASSQGSSSSSGSSACSRSLAGVSTLLSLPLPIGTLPFGVPDLDPVVLSPLSLF